MIKNWEYRRGDIYLADLSPFCGSEQGGVRPVVVIQNNTGNKHAPTLVVATITAKDQKKDKTANPLSDKKQPGSQQTIPGSVGAAKND